MIHRLRPSPSMLVALIALFVALGGGAYAALAKNSVKSKHIAPNAATGADVNEASLGQVPSAAFANSAATAATAGNGVLGYAVITQVGTVSDAFSSLNIVDANVTHSPGSGAYCFADLPFTPNHIQVTGWAFDGNDNSVDNFWSANVSDTLLCPNTQQAVVTSYDDDPAAVAVPQDAHFFVVFF